MTTVDCIAPQQSTTARRIGKPRIGFVGVGWIGRNRLEAIAKADLVDIVAIADPAEELRRKAGEAAADAALVETFDELIEVGLDGVVVATPSALHAEQASVALERGLAVFCQKPLGRTAAETRRVIEAARNMNVLLGVDLSYRFMTEVQKVCELVRSGELGNVYAAELVFHNAYGPDKPWFYDYKLSGGGCVIDLGIHLVDFALWSFGWPKVLEVSSRLFSNGTVLTPNAKLVEDFATARIDLSNGASVQMSCSWKSPAGRDAIISGTFYGTRGGASFYNIDGSFYEFAAERFYGTKRELLADTKESWGGKAAIDWAARLADGRKYDSEIEGLITVAETLDRIYHR